MPTLSIPPGYAQASMTFRHSSLARAALITFGLDVGDAGGDYLAIAQDMPGLLGAQFDDIIDADVTVGEPTLRVGQDGGEALVVVGTASFVGLRTSPSLPGNNAALIRKATNRGGRRGRGRLFLPWVLSEADVDEVGAISSTKRSELATSAQNWLNNMPLSSPPHQMVLLHSTGLSALGNPDPVVSMSCDPLIGSQRRRLGRR